MNSLRLTRRDRRLLELLAKKLRCAAGRQLVDRSLPRTDRMTTERLVRLVRAGWLGRAVVTASLPELDGPLAVWRPGTEPPSFSELATILRRRDRDAVPRRIAVYWATEQAVEWVDGCGGKPRQPLQIQHDLGVAEVYFTRRLLDEQSERGWISEDIFRELNAGATKVPDALLLSPQGRPMLAIEFGGAYGRLRLMKFHRFCLSRNLPYEVW